MASVTNTDGIPAYAAELDALHRAHEAEFEQIIDDLPLAPGAKVLDLACGDGNYTRLLAQKVAPGGLVIGADASLQYLGAAQNETKQLGRTSELVAAEAERLPVSDDSFDLVWCAHSLISLPDPEPTLREMWRVVRPGGMAAIMETDSLHDLLLPWPEELEIAIRQAELRAYRNQTRRPEKRYMGRRLRLLMNRAGFSPVCRKTYATDRISPLSLIESKLLRRKLRRLKELVWPYLSENHRSEFSRLADEDSPSNFFVQEGFAMTWLDMVCWGRKTPML